MFISHLFGLIGVGGGVVEAGIILQWHYMCHHRAAKFKLYLVVVNGRYRMSISAFNVIGRYHTYL